MCGISGILSPHSEKVSAQVLKSMNDTLIHRGPDGEGYYQSHEDNLHIGFAHRRLSIVDLTENSAQPFHYLERFVLNYNGEIYNYKELRHTLESQGYIFATSGDTEVVAAAFACYGENCMDHFDGMFAFAIWDKKEKNLFCARDRFGEKPFYYHYDQARQEFYFASEMKALFATGISRDINHQKLYDYITLGYTKNVSYPDNSFYQFIHQLPPSHYLKFWPARNILETGRYWDLDKENMIDMYADQAVEKFQEMFQSSVELRLHSDVAAGTSLSGGIDSSSILAIAETSGISAYSHKAFSAVFPGFEKDESSLIHKTITRFNADLFSVTPSADGLAEKMKKLLYHQEEPFGSASVFAQFEVYALAKQHNIKVLLDGQGADEILGGYKKYVPWYLQEKIQTEGWKMISEEAAALKENEFLTEFGWKNRLATMMPSVVAAQLKSRALQKRSSTPYIDKAYARAYADPSSVFKPLVEKLNDIQYYDTMVMGLEELLRYADRNSMANSREVRLPFLSHKLAQFVFSLPSSFRVRNGFTKWILRKAMDDKLPAAITWQKGKTGFEPPQKQWMQSPAIVENVREAQKKLVKEKICTPEVLDAPLQPADSHDENNFDWRCWVASAFIS